MKNRVIVLAVVFVVVMTGGFLYNKYRVAPNIDFSCLQLTDLNNTPVKLSQYKGKILFLNFFGTWCGPCVREIPSLQKAAVSLKNNDFIFISISDEPLDRLQDFRTVMDSGPIVLHSVKSLKELKVFTVPTNYLLNTDGKVVFKNTGVKNWDSDEIMQELKSDALK